MAACRLQLTYTALASLSGRCSQGSRLSSGCDWWPSIISTCHCMWEEALRDFVCLGSLPHATVYTTRYLHLRVHVSMTFVIQYHAKQSGGSHALLLPLAPFFVSLPSVYVCALPSLLPAPPHLQYSVQQCIQPLHRNWHVCLCLSVCLSVCCAGTCIMVR